MFKLASYTYSSTLCIQVDFIYRQFMFLSVYIQDSCINHVAK